MWAPKLAQAFISRSGFFCLGLLVSTGCGGGDDGNKNSSNVTISSQQLTGRIGGQAWSLGTAQSDSFLSTSDQFWVDMYAETIAACDSSARPSGSNSLIANLPKTAGSYDMSLALNATFFISSSNDNLVATTGRIQIDSVTATTITGGMNVTYNADNSLDGQFQATICP
jgi:hypothetical protein